MVMVGPNLDLNNLELVDLINKCDLESHVMLLGRRNDAAIVWADIYVSSILARSFERN